MIHNLQVQESNVSRIIHLANLLESCDFKQFWARLREIPELHRHVVGFQDSIRKFVCHVIGITFQTINKNLLAQLLGDVDCKLFFYLFLSKTSFKFMRADCITFKTSITLLRSRVIFSNEVEKFDFPLSSENCL